MRNDTICDHPAAARIVWDNDEICDDCGEDLGDWRHADDYNIGADLLGINPYNARRIA